MARSVKERVASALTEDGNLERDKALKLTEWFKEANKDISEGVRRSVLFYFLTVLVFELVVTTNIKKIIVGGAELTELSSLIVFAPTLAAYFYLESIILSVRCGDLHDAVREAMKIWNNTSLDNDIELLVRPRISLFWPIGIGPQERNSTWLRRYEWWLFVGFLVLAILLEVAFSIQAFISLATKVPGPSQVLFIGNVAATALLLVACVPYLSYFSFWPKKTVDGRTGPTLDEASPRAAADGTRPPPRARR